jgi:hypothetical protein
LVAPASGSISPYNSAPEANFGADLQEGLAKAREAQIAQQQRMTDIATGPGGDNRMDGASIPVDKLNASNEEYALFPVSCDNAARAE